MLSRKTFILLVFIGVTSAKLIAQKYEPAPWPDKEPKFESAYFMRAGVTVSSIDESLKLYRDILGLEVLLDRKGMFDPRLPDFSGIQPDQTIRLTILKTKMDGEELLNGGYIALSEICDSEGKRLPAEDNVKTTGKEPGSIMLQFLVDDVIPIHKEIVTLGYEVISEPVEREDGSHSELLVRDPNGIRLWITDRYSRTIFLKKVNK